MFNMVIIIIGLIEFCIGITISIFARSEKAKGFTKFLYDFDEDECDIFFLNR